MKKNILLLSLLSLLSLLFIILCKNILKNPPKNEIDFETKEGSRSELSIIYGEWIPGKLVGFTKISAMDDQIYQKFIQQYSLYSYRKEVVKIGEEILNNPMYKIEKNDSETFSEEWEIELSTLGINSEEVTIISILENETTDWNNPGTILIIDNDKRMITLWDGGFFELLKK